MTESLASLHGLSGPSRLDPGVEPRARFGLGVPALDAALGGGLDRGRLHELYGASEIDLAATLGFALMLAMRAGGRQGNIVWIAQARTVGAACPLYPPGLAELGADPARLLFVTAPDETALLRAAADVVRSPAAGTAVIAPAGSSGRIDLTASRRLALAAERSGVTAMLLRGAGAQSPSAAATRWLVAAAPSIALEAEAPGAPAFHVDLVRRRDGPPAPGWRLEWDRDAACFAEPAPKRRYLAIWLPRLAADCWRAEHCGVPREPALEPIREAMTLHREAEARSRAEIGRRRAVSDRSTPRAPPPPPLYPRRAVGEDAADPAVQAGSAAVPLVFTERQANAVRLTALSAAAARLGFMPGITLADARARVPELVAIERDHAAEGADARPVGRGHAALHARRRARAA